MPRLPSLRPSLPWALPLLCLLTGTGLGAASEAFAPGRAGSGTLALAGGIAVLRLQGPPAVLGAQEAALCPAPLRELWRQLVPRALPGALGHVPACYRPELVAIARQLAVPEDLVATADLLLDSGCTAIVAPAAPAGPLLVGRTVDTGRADLLGRMTCVRMERSPGRHAVVSVGWPGFGGVISGMNDTGLTGSLLLNQTSDAHRAGEPICFRLRRILEQSTSCAEAVRCFAATPVASSHYVLLASADDAVLVWQDEHGVHTEHPRGRWLTVTNAGRAGDGHAADARGRWVARQCQALPIAASPAWLRRCLTGCYLRTGNPQAMVWEPAARRLELALAQGSTPAALSPWTELPLTPLFQGAPLPSPCGQPLGVEAQPLAHS